jgi:hypothetical protein
MNTVASQIHATRYRPIQEIVLHVDRGDDQQASTLLTAMRHQLPTPITRPEDIQAAFFLTALTKRLDPNSQDAGNLYLMPDQGQQIRMFNFMAEKFPLVRFAQDLVNAAHLDTLYACAQENSTMQEIVLLDIGIGSGQQLARLIQPIAERFPALKQLVVIGIEPAAESLNTAEAALAAKAVEAGLSLEFMGVPKALEALDESDWQRLSERLSNRSGPFLANASFALHHTPPAVLRDQLFAWLHVQKPALLALIEPDADFVTTDLLQRFDNAWQHYGLTFNAIDAIDASVDEKNLVKTVFFSREIQDVLAEDAQRIERFETGDMWLNRIRRAGFEPDSVPPSTETVMPGFPFVTLTRKPGHTILNMDGHPLVSILTARCR